MATGAQTLPFILDIVFFLQLLKEISWNVLTQILFSETRVRISIPFTKGAFLSHLCFTLALTCWLIGKESLVLEGNASFLVSLCSLLDLFAEYLGTRYVFCDYHLQPTPQTF